MLRNESCRVRGLGHINHLQANKLATLLHINLHNFRSLSLCRSFLLYSVPFFLGSLCSLYPPLGSFFTPVTLHLKLEQLLYHLLLSWPRTCRTARAIGHAQLQQLQQNVEMQQLIV